MLDKNRLHLNHGPIDLIVQCWGAGRHQALELAEARFQTVLQELVEELELLRQPLNANPVGKVARRMATAVALFEQFVTPMAAVAGAVADEILENMASAPNLKRAYVNNGGDIACFLAEGERLDAAVPNIGSVRLTADQPARGLATSGWRGRSYSLGIADAVTVVAENAAAADVAATLIANAVDLVDHAEILRSPANSLDPDSDLGQRLVTIDVGQLPVSDIANALELGRLEAKAMLNKQHIHGAALLLQGQSILVGAFPETAKLP